MSNVTIALELISIGETAVRIPDAGKDVDALTVRITPENSPSWVGRFAAALMAINYPAAFMPGQMACLSLRFSVRKFVIWNRNEPIPKNLSFILLLSFFDLRLKVFILICSYQRSSAVICGERFGSCLTSPSRSTFLTTSTLK